MRNARTLKRRLAEVGFRQVRARHFETNYLFDFPDLRLLKANCLLRVRFAGNHAGTWGKLLLASFLQFGVDWK